MASNNIYRIWRKKAKQIQLTFLRTDEIYYYTSSQKRANTGSLLLKVGDSQILPITDRQRAQTGRRYCNKCRPGLGEERTQRRNVVLKADDIF